MQEVMLRMQDHYLFKKWRYTQVILLCIWASRRENYIIPRVKYLAVVARSMFYIANQNVWLSCIRVFCVTHYVCLLHTI
jgi:hypothetical protein